MKHICTYIICTVLLLISSHHLSAQRFGEGERGERLKALWVAFVTQELELTPDESTKFWPMYNEYIEKERDLNKSKRKLNKKPIADMNEAEIDQYFSQLLSVDEQLIALKREYYTKLKTAIPARKIIQLPQVERAFKKKIIQYLHAQRNGARGADTPRADKKF